MPQDSADIIGLTITGDVQVFDGSRNSIIITTAGSTLPSDHLIVLSATDLVANYLSSKLGAGLSISGTNIINTITLDGKVLLSATDGTPGYLSTKIGAGLTLSGTNILALVTALDYKILMSATDGTPGYLLNKLGAGLTASGTAVRLINTMAMAYGSTTISGTTVTISGLTFANSESYSLVAIYNTSAFMNYPLRVTQDSGSQATVKGENQKIRWIAIGT